MTDDLIYRPFSRLVRIRIRGRWFEVPENNILLRCFQYISPQVPYGPFCWNGDCENDALCVKGQGGSTARPALACQTLVADGMELESLSADLERALAPALRKAPGAEDAELVGPPAGSGPSSG